MPDIFCIVNNSSRTKSRKRSNHLVHMRNFASLCIHLPDMFTLNAVDICILTFLYFLDSIDVGIIVDIIIIMNTRKKVESSNWNISIIFGVLDVYSQTEFVFWASIVHSFQEGFNSFGKMTGIQADISMLMGVVHPSWIKNRVTVIPFGLVILCISKEYLPKWEIPHCNMPNFYCKV